MSLFAIFAIAFALAVDAFVVALSSGIHLKRVTLSNTLQISTTFGGFQFVMPLIGWWLGKETYQYIEQYDHWVAFSLLVFVGYRMIKESLSHKKSYKQHNPANPAILLLLGIATSLDALAVGLSFGLLKMPIWIPAMIIGLVCFCVSTIGLHMGKLIAQMPKLGLIGNQSNLIGGLLLCGIGVNILFQHGVFHFA